MARAAVHLAARPPASSRACARSSSTARASAASAKRSRGSATTSSAASPATSPTISSPRSLQRASTSMATAVADAVAAARGAMTPLPYRVVAEARRTTTTGRSPRARRRRDQPLRARPVHDALRLRRRRGADLDQRRPDAERPMIAHDSRGRRGDERALRGVRRRRRRRARPVRQALAGGGRATAATSSRRPAASAWRRCAHRLLCAAHRERLRARLVLYGAPHAGDLLFRENSSAGERAWTSTSTSPSTRAGSRLARRGRRGHEAHLRRARFDPRTTAALVVRAGDHDALRRASARRARRGAATDLDLDGAQHAMRCRPVRPLPARPTFICRDGPVYRYDRRACWRSEVREL